MLPIARRFQIISPWMTFAVPGFAGVYHRLTIALVSSQHNDACSVSDSSGSCGEVRETAMAFRILYVEDEAEIAEFVAQGLREEGFLVERAPDGHSGTQALATSTWDLVILDWWLPGPGGYDLLRGFRQAGKTTPVLFLTARDAVEQRVQGLNA